MPQTLKSNQYPNNQKQISKTKQSTVPQHTKVNKAQASTIIQHKQQAYYQLTKPTNQAVINQLTKPNQNPTTI